jgi:modulator of FtsH protease
MVNSSLYEAIVHKKIDLESIGNTNLFHLILEKKGFILLTLINLIFQLFICYFVMIKYNKPISLYEIFGIYLLIIIILLIIIFVPMNYIFKFILFCVVSGLTGLVLITFKQILQLNIFHKIQILKKIDNQVIDFTLLGVMSVYITLALLSLFLFISEFHLSYYFGIVLFYLLLFIILGNLSTFLFGHISNTIKFILCVGIFIYSIYILYDTTNILHRNYSGDIITASFDYYCDIGTILLYIYLYFVNILLKYVNSQSVNE